MLIVLKQKRLMSVDANYTRYALNEGSGQQFKTVQLRLLGNAFVPCACDLGKLRLISLGALAVRSLGTHIGVQAGPVPGIMAPFAARSEPVPTDEPYWSRHWHKKLKKGHADIQAELVAPYRPKAWLRS